jgi:outer membrane protein OmpA-like peptidoglycan-associated protein
MKTRAVIGMVVALTFWITPAPSQPAAATYNDLMAQGEQLRTDHRWEDAIARYREAAGRALEHKEIARAQYRMAQSYEDLKDPDAALLWYRKSLEHADYPETEAAIKRLQTERFDRGVTASEIVRGLSISPSRSQGISPSIDLPVNFDTNQDTLSPDGQRQVAALAEALANPTFAGDRFVLVGHTDKRGNDDLNQKLSERRARRVQQVLTAQFGLQASRFDVLGMGRRQLLFQGDSPEDHRLNRRVEVKRLRAAEATP